MKKSLLSSAILSMMITVGLAQTQTTKISPCATYKAQEFYSKTIPGYKQQLDAVNARNAQEFEAYKQTLRAQRTSSLSAAYTFTIPVVFHILHMNGPENIADNVCIAALDQVNKDYARKGADTTSIDPLYEPLYVNSHMHFVLAKKDPYGNCTTGIVHHYDKNTEWDQSNLQNYMYSTVGTYNWSPSHYLNVYVVDNIIPSGSVLGGGTIVGYTHLPGTAPNVGADAIVYNCRFLGGLEARSLSHEIGHWFGLSHTFGGTNDAGVICGNDDIYDTPATAGFYSNCPLPYTALNDSCDPGHRPNMNNFMDYSGCPMMFTQGQTDKIRFSAQATTANRSYLVDTTNLVYAGIFNQNIVSINATTGDTTFSYALAPTTICGPVADFYATKAKACQGQVVVYNSTTFNNTTGLTYSWEFEGGTPATSSAATPSVSYAIPGSYSTTLTVTNSAGTSSKVRNPFVDISWHVNQASYPAQEGFEASAATGLFPPGWTAINPDYATIGWQYANYGSNSSKCMILPNANGGNQMFTGSNIDILETNQYNFSNTTNITLAFDYSYARKTGAAGDAFNFEYSTDCGGTWSTLGTTPTSTVMAVSGGTVNAPYIPYTQAKWVTKTYASSVMGVAVGNKPDVKFRFWFRNTPNGDAQNLYIDNLNISGTVGIEEFESTIGLSIYPNPTASSSTVEFTSPVDAKVSVNVVDVTGRLVEENNFNAVAGDLTRYNVNKNAVLKAGIYFVTLNLNSQKITKKLIVE